MKYSPAVHELARSVRECLTRNVPYTTTLDEYWKGWAAVQKPGKKSRPAKTPTNQRTTPTGSI